MKAHTSEKMRRLLAQPGSAQFVREAIVEPTAGAFAAPYLILEWQARRVHLYGTLRPPQRRVIPALIGLIALFDTPGLFLDLARGRLASGILEQPPSGPLLEPRNKENFHVRVGKDDGAHISAVGHQISVSAHAALHPEQPITDRR